LSTQERVKMNSSSCDEIVERDKRDTERDVAPLVKADDAVEVDTTGLDIDEVVSRILEIVRAGE
jgi:CMP/dCMP kinase